MNKKVQYLGVDVAKAKLDVDLHSKVIQVSNDPKGFAALKKFLTKFELSIHIIVEASGPYHLPLVAWLQSHDITVSVVNPRQVRDFAKSKGQLAKTDTIDSRLLSQYGTERQPKPTPALPECWQLLAGLVDRREQILSMITAESNRLDHQHPQVAKLLRSHLRQLKAQLAKVDEQLKELVAENPDLKLRHDTMTQVLGVGTVTALGLLAAVPELGTLNRAQAATLTGTAPLNRDSGTWRGHRTTWGGRKKARKALYMAAIVASRHNPPLRAFYQRLIAQGKRPKVALVAIMRKLVILLNSMLKSLNPLHA